MGVLLPLSLLLFSLSRFEAITAVCAPSDEDKSTVYVIFMGEKRHNDPDLVEDSHHRLLSSVLGVSKAVAAETILHSYKHGFSGFAAKLTESQALSLKRHPEVVHVGVSKMLKLHTTRSWDFLGLPLHGCHSHIDANSGDNLLAQSQMGRDVIIGMIDSGVWPESESFSDEGYSPVPSRWKGRCVDGELFNSTEHCNKKLIGARWYVKAFLTQTGRTDLRDSEEDFDYMSARDSNGHGTHTASTAAGSPVEAASFNGLAVGVARGGAPAARLAVYKVGWLEGLCASADVIKAFDDAIHDRVDVLSASVGQVVPLFPEASEPENAVVIGAFHAVARGIPVVTAAGNSGPAAGTVTNSAPWTIDVAASTVDRAFTVDVTLGDNQTLVAQGMNVKKLDTRFVNLKYYPGTFLEGRGGRCSNLPKNDSSMAGSVILCFGGGVDTSSIQRNGGIGIIVALDRALVQPIDNSSLIAALVDYESGTRIINYFYSSRTPCVKIGQSTTQIGKPFSTKISFFSSRGPNTIAPEILKPDVAAPGVNILAACPPPKIPAPGVKVMHKGMYKFDSGTSMACPHVTGVVALLKSVHPAWSPAAIKSALVTTASTTDKWGEPIVSEGLQKISDPFDYGGGIINPNKARDPGLVYDMGMSDYIQYLCSMGYPNTSISKLAGKTVTCPSKMPSSLDVNLPSFIIPNLQSAAPVTVHRRVTNVGSTNSVYYATIHAPKGVKMTVTPKVLVFNSTVMTSSFSVTFWTTHKVQGGYYFGGLSGSDGSHVVKSPIGVRTQFVPYYSDFS